MDIVVWGSEMIAAGLIVVVFERMEVMKGFAYKGKNGRYLIVINSLLCTEMQHTVYLHELRHCWDMCCNQETNEKTADSYALAIMQAASGFCSV